MLKEVLKSAVLSAKKSNIAYERKYDEMRATVRGQLRNNPQYELGFGALTGQPEAINFGEVSQFNIQPGDVILVYTDGVEPVLNEITKHLRAGGTLADLEKLCKTRVSSEGTLIAKTI